MFKSKVICCMLWFVFLSFVCGRHLSDTDRSDHLAHPVENYVPEPSEARFQGGGMSERRSSGASMPVGLNTDDRMFPAASLDTLEVQRGLDLSSRPGRRVKRYIGYEALRQKYAGKNSTNDNNNSEAIES